MGKLNVVVPAVNVTVDGVEYHKVDRAVQEGDIVRIYGADVRFITEGGFYAVDEVDWCGDAQITDDDGDSYDTCGQLLDVYEKIAEKPALPVRLTVGDYAKVINAIGMDTFADGDVVKITEDDGHATIPYRVCTHDGKRTWCKSSRLVRATEAEFLAQRQPDLVAEAPQEDAIFVHEGLRYRKVARKANVGDLVLVIESFVYGTAGDIATVTKSPAISGDVMTTMHQLMNDNRYVVLEPLNAPTTVTEVNRAARVGERIRIVNMRDHNVYGMYKNGDEFVVDAVAFSVDVKVDAVKCEGNNGGLILRDEYVVLENVEVEPAPVERLKVGDYAKVTESGAGMLEYRNPGDIVIITENDGSNIPFNTKHIDGRYAGWAYKSSLVRATDAEVAAAKAEAERKEAEEAVRKQREETERKWAAIGRKVDEYKAGDIVRVTEGFCEVKRGDIGEITNADGSRLPGVTVRGIQRFARVEVIVPVEQRFDTL